jgi:gliding motility-associated-like protein
VVYVIKEEPIIYPNIFKTSLQGDNSKFKIVGKSILKIKDFSLFDRWGNVVYSVKDITVDQLKWDGALNGKLVEQGVYLFKTTLLLKDHSVKNILGDVTVIR